MKGSDDGSCVGIILCACIRESLNTTTKKKIHARTHSLTFLRNTRFPLQIDFPHPLHALYVLFPSVVAVVALLFHVHFYRRSTVVDQIHIHRCGIHVLDSQLYCHLVHVAQPAQHHRVLDYGFARHLSSASPTAATGHGTGTCGTGTTSPRRHRESHNQWWWWHGNRSRGNRTAGYGRRLTVPDNAIKQVPDDARTERMCNPSCHQTTAPSVNIRWCRCRTVSPDTPRWIPPRTLCRHSPICRTRIHSCNCVHCATPAISLGSVGC